MYKRILIATDGSPTAAKAVDVGSDLARNVKAETILVHVGDPKQGEKVLAAAGKAVGGQPKTGTGAGDPADKILEVGGNDDGGLIVVGNKGMTRAKRALL